VTSLEFYFYMLMKNNHHIQQWILYIERLYTLYIPKIIQTDNCLEFTRHKKSKESGKHLFDRLCDSLNIEHKLIRPRKVRHNGKV